jgi:DNA mismatch endonuclease, patch repair protein
MSSDHTSQKRAGRNASAKKFLRDGRAPIPRKIGTSISMSGNRATGTRPEVQLRSALLQGGITRFRNNVRSLPGTPDIVFYRNNVAVFLHGCFWHRCPRCKLPLPRTHTQFWREKFARNVARDKKNERELRKQGWRVLVIWECALRRNPEAAASRVKRIVS